MGLCVLASGLVSALAGSLIGWLLTRRMRRNDLEKQQPGRPLPASLYISLPDKGGGRQPLVRTLKKNAATLGRRSF